MSGDSPELGTSALLHALIDRGDTPRIRFQDLLAGFERRAFGVLLLLASLPTLIPGVAAISGPIVALAGFQLLIGLKLPWLPRFARERQMERSSLKRVLNVLDPWLKRLERLCRPRLQVLWRQGALRLVGFMLLVLGIALALPIPFTNYVIAAPIVVLAFGLTEHDGLILLIGIVLALLALAVVGVAYGALLIKAWEWVQGWW
jgi:hypothetical protein